MMTKQERDKKYLDTYNAMTKEEQEEIILLQKIKTNIKYFVGIDNIISKISSLIDDCNEISFASERNRKYISKTKPMFVLKLNKSKIKHNFDYTKSDGKDFFIDGKLNPIYEDDIHFIQTLVYEQIVRPYGKFLMTYLKEEDKFSEILKENNVSNKLDKKVVNELILTFSAVMFAIKVDLKGEKIFLEYSV